MAVAGSANAAASFFIGPNGVHIGYSDGYWYDRYHHRHYYRYPSDWRRYGYPMSWYRNHDRWWERREWLSRFRDHDRDRYRDRRAYNYYRDRY